MSLWILNPMHGHVMMIPTTQQTKMQLQGVPLGPCNKRTRSAIKTKRGIVSCDVMMRSYSPRCTSVRICHSGVLRVTLTTPGHIVEQLC